MCRLASFPPGFPREKAIEILLRFEGNNTDGIGACYVKDGKFQVLKTPNSLSSLLKSPDGEKFLSHMPYNGWTIAHLRLASHGSNKMENTHPFIINDWGFVHNGVWSDYRYAKPFVLAFDSKRLLKGETDSEVAGNVIDMIGPKKFVEEFGGGVYLGLRRDGDLWVMKTHGDLEIYEHKNKSILMASTLDPVKYKDKSEVKIGWYHYDKEGKLIEGEAKKYNNTGYNSWESQPYYQRYHKNYSGTGASNCKTSTCQGGGGGVTSANKSAELTQAEMEHFSEYGWMD